MTVSQVLEFCSSTFGPGSDVHTQYFKVAFMKHYSRILLIIMKLENTQSMIHASQRISENA